MTKPVQKKIFFDFKNKREVGNLGEEIACAFLIKKNFRIIERNYLKKWGEIDIIAVKDRVLTFIEVKSVIDNRNFCSASFRPEENVHAKKQIRLRRTIQTYLAQRGYGPGAAFLFHILTVRMNTRTRRARVELIENIIL
jgi:putative endonuclease